MPDLSNDMLTLWLRAKDGLPADEARALIERLAEAEGMAAHLEEEVETQKAQAYDEGHAAALEGNTAFHEGKAEGLAQGRREGRRGALLDVVRIINGPGWGRKPTLANIIEDINRLIKEPANV